MREVTLAFRAAVRDTKHNQLLIDITLDEIMSGEIEIPDVVLHLGESDQYQKTWRTQ